MCAACNSSAESQADSTYLLVEHRVQMVLAGRFLGCMLLEHMVAGCTFAVGTELRILVRSAPAEAPVLAQSRSGELVSASLLPSLQFVCKRGDTHKILVYSTVVNCCSVS